MRLATLTAFDRNVSWAAEESRGTKQHLHSRYRRQALNDHHKNYLSCPTVQRCAPPNGPAKLHSLIRNRCRFFNPQNVLHFERVATAPVMTGGRIRPDT
jgi:hypothetical protein